jgi:hypothetical protein
VFYLNYLFAFRVVRFELLVFPLLTDIAVLEPDNFVAQLLGRHHSLHAWVPYLDPAIVVFCYTHWALELTFEVYCTENVLGVLFRSVDILDLKFHFGLLNTEPSLENF